MGILEKRRDLFHPTYPFYNSNKEKATRPQTTNLDLEIYKSSSLMRLGGGGGVLVARSGSLARSSSLAHSRLALKRGRWVRSSVVVVVCRRLVRSLGRRSLRSRHLSQTGYGYNEDEHMTHVPKRIRYVHMRSKISLATIFT